MFYEFYYFDRWYNVFQIYSKSGELKGLVLQHRRRGLRMESFNS